MRGFTFEQLAVILLVLLGMSFALILATSQFRNLGTALGIFGRQANTSASTAVDVVNGSACPSAGGFCASSCNTYVSNANPALDCSGGDKCCLT